MKDEVRGFIEKWVTPDLDRVNEQRVFDEAESELNTLIEDRVILGRILEAETFKVNNPTLGDPKDVLHCVIDFQKSRVEYLRNKRAELNNTKEKGAE